jgi:hypothetical protein
VAESPQTEPDNPPQEARVTIRILDKDLADVASPPDYLRTLERSRIPREGLAQAKPALAHAA